MGKPYVYMIACPDTPWWPLSKGRAELIDEIQEMATPVKFETMRKHCEGLAEWMLWKGVVIDHRGIGSVLNASDWIAFKKSFYDGIPCYFVDWSGIEYIWMKESVLDELDIEPRVPPWDAEGLMRLGLDPVDPRTEHLPDFPGISIFKIFRKR